MIYAFCFSLHCLNIMSLSVCIIIYIFHFNCYHLIYLCSILFELLSIKHTMFPYGVQIVLNHFEIFPIGVYTYYLFCWAKIYFVNKCDFIVCMSHIYRVRPCVVFHYALPCTCTYDRGTHRLSPSLIVLLSPLPW